MELTILQKRRARRKKDLARLYVELRESGEAKSNLMILRTIEQELSISISTARRWIVEEGVFRPFAGERRG